MYLSVVPPSTTVIPAVDGEPAHAPANALRLFTMCDYLGQHTYFVVQVEVAKARRAGKGRTLRVFLNTLPPNFREYFRDEKRKIVELLKNGARQVVALRGEIDASEEFEIQLVLD